MPSNSVSSAGTTVFSTSDETPEPRVRNSASSSSKKTTTGAPSEPRARARWNTSRIRRSVSPTNLSSSSGPLTDRNSPGRPTRAASDDATAFAIIVLPQPGGPYSRTPVGAVSR